MLAGRSITCQTIWSVWVSSGRSTARQASTIARLGYWFFGQAVRQKERSDPMDRSTAVKPAHPVFYQEALLGTRKQAIALRVLGLDKKTDGNQVRDAVHMLHFQPVALRSGEFIAAA